jgi:glycosyltransferase involved in cell wall biosynthesis
MRTDRVAFLMPVHDGAVHLVEAIDSLLAQHDTAWRLVAIDDASHDESYRILERYAEDPRITVIRRDRNLGLYGTLAAAVPEVDAEWIAIVMQDDVLKPAYLTEMRRLAATFPDADGFWANEDIIDAAGRVVARGLDTGRTEPIPPGREPWLGALERGCIWTISGSFTRRSALRDVPFRADLPHCGDFDWFLRAVRERRFVYYERTLASLRRHAGQSSTTNLQWGRDLREALQVVTEQVRAHPGDVPRWRLWRFGRQRSWGVVRRVAAAARHGRWGEAVRLSRHIGGWAWLPVRAAVGRRRVARRTDAPSRTI